MSATLNISANNAVESNISQVLPNRETTAAVGEHLKSVALFLAAPFIGLVYAMSMPFVGLAMMAMVAYQAASKSVAARQALASVVRVVALLASPLLGLVYAVALPFVGIALIARAAYQAARA